MVNEEKLNRIVKKNIKKALNEGIFDGIKQRRADAERQGMLANRGSNSIGEFGLIYRYAQEALQDLLDGNQVSTRNYLIEIMETAKYYSQLGADFAGWKEYSTEKTFGHPEEEDQLMPGRKRYSER